MTVPTDSDYLVGMVVSGGNGATINGTALSQDMLINRIVLEGGTDIEGVAIMQGHDIGGSDLTTVTEFDPVVPSGETWVGGYATTGQASVSINGMQATNITVGSTWMALEGGDDMSANSRGNIFGGIIK
jgi:hypothetical protein